MSLRQSIAVHAAQLRENMAIGDSEVIGDIVDHIQEAGYRYMEKSFGDEFSGFSQVLRDGNFLIGFNRDHFWSDNSTDSHSLMSWDILLFLNTEKYWKQKNCIDPRASSSQEIELNGKQITSLFVFWLPRKHFRQR